MSKIPQICIDEGNGKGSQYSNVVFLGANLFENMRYFSSKLIFLDEIGWLCQKVLSFQKV